MISTNITNNIALDLRELIIKRDESLRNFLPEENVIIASLLHDVCKADIYKPSSWTLPLGIQAGRKMKRMFCLLYEASQDTRLRISHSSAGVSQGKRTNVKFCLTEGANLDLITGNLKTVDMFST